MWQRTFGDSSVLWERVEAERIIPPPLWKTAPRLPHVDWRDALSAGLRWHWHPQVLERYIACSMGRNKKLCCRTQVPAFANECLLPCGIIFMSPERASLSLYRLRSAARTVGECLCLWDVLARLAAVRWRVRVALWHVLFPS